MENSSFCDKETKMLNKFYNFQLANSYKKFGYYIAFGTFGLMIAKKFFMFHDSSTGLGGAGAEFFLQF